MVNRLAAGMVILGIVFVVALAALSLTQIEVPAPKDWLIKWTNWVATVVAIIVSSRVVWIGAEAFYIYVWRHTLGRDPGG